MKRTRRFFSTTLLFVSFVVAWAPLTPCQEDYPKQPIKILVPFGPGSVTDGVARTLSETLSKDLKVNVIIDYKTGSGGMVGSDAVATGKPDGYTVLLGSIASHISGPILTPNPPYDPIKDFAPIAYVGETPNVIFVNSQSDYKTFDDFLNYSKKNPGKVNGAVAGPGTVGHFMIESINLVTGAGIVSVPYKEPGQCLTAVLGQHVDMTILGLSVGMAQVKAGSLRVLISTTKIPDSPEIPTFKEKKLEQVSLGTWCGFMVHSATPKAIQDKLVPAFAKAIKDPENIKKLEKLGFVTEYKPPAEFADLMKSHLEIVKKTARAANLIK